LNGADQLCALEFEIIPSQSCAVSSSFCEDLVEESTVYLEPL